MSRYVDPSAERPVYHQLADIIRDEIRSGSLPPGRPLPSEGRLAQEYAIGKDAVRDALQVLRSEGLVTTESGVGSRVREPLERELIHLADGETAWARMPTREERQRLRIPEGTPILIVERGGEQKVYLGDRTAIAPR
jgi:GntR family transcriptional regulator